MKEGAMISTREYELVRLQARRIVLEEDIAAKWAFRRWYRTQARAMFAHRWDDLDALNTAELREMIAALRQTRLRAATR